MSAAPQDPAYRFGAFALFGSAALRRSSHGWEVQVAFDATHHRYAFILPGDTPADEAASAGIKQAISRAADEAALPREDTEVAAQTNPRLYQAELRPGERWPRIWRPGPATRTPLDEESRSATRLALRALDRRAQTLLEVVHPVAQLSTHGHLIRELLMLAAMEVESSCKAILRANAYPGSRLTTNDYVKLADPLILRDYRLRLIGYPELDDFAPFRDWDPADPTNSLPWYRAYNLTKHSREEHLAAGTLGLALAALGGAWALHAAQFGGARVGLVGVDHSAVEHDSTLFQLSPRSRKLDSRTGYVAGYKQRDLAFVSYDFGRT